MTRATTRIVSLTKINMNDISHSTSVHINFDEPDAAYMVDLYMSDENLTKENIDRQRRLAKKINDFTTSNYIKRESVFCFTALIGHPLKASNLLIPLKGACKSTIPVK